MQSPEITPLAHVNWTPLSGLEALLFSQLQAACLCLFYTDQWLANYSLQANVAHHLLL